MNRKKVEKILADTAYVRVSGTEEEKRCAAYLKELCEELGLDARMETFPVNTYTVEQESLTVMGQSIPCRSYYGCEKASVSAELYYLSSNTPEALKRCRGKIVLLDGGMPQDQYDLLVENGAKGFITYSGTLHLPDRDIDRKWIDFETEPGKGIPGVNIHACDAARIADLSGESAQIVLSQTAHISQSQNVVLDLEGETEETIVISAHYDSTPFSVGAYDNMSGCLVLLYLAEYFSAKPRRRRIRLLWCGSEEPCLVGSLIYCERHKEEFENVILNVNLDMLGCVMGEMVAFSSANEEIRDFLQEFLDKSSDPGSVRYGIRASDSNSFVHYGVPSVSFARYAPEGMAPIHTRYDTAAVMSAGRLLKDAALVAEFTEYMANEEKFSFPLTISEKIRSDVEKYLKGRPRAIR